MNSTVSVIVPVRDGARYLGELLDAVAAQRVDANVEVLVVDSGSRDRSADIARDRGARVLEIAPHEFGHGRTRNLAAEHTSGEVVVYLTQDATPAHDEWLARLIAPLDDDGRIGMALGPHEPRPDTSPSIARELREFFGSFTDHELRIDTEAVAADPASGFFSNVNSAVLRTCWEEVRFRDVAYAEDQAFARDAMRLGWRKAYVPSAAVLHAHDYPFGQFMRRYFDEYRGLADTIGHVEPAHPRAITRRVVAGLRGDVSYMRDMGWDNRRLAIGTGRSLRHHAGRAVFSALGSRAERLPASLALRLSLEDGARTSGRPLPYEYVRPYFTGPAAPLLPPSPGDATRERLHIAWLIPPFRRGSGGHNTIFMVADQLERSGHSCSIWVHDPTRVIHGGGAGAQRELHEGFAELKGGVFSGFDDWHGADIAIATGWQTAYPLWTLPGCKLKAYLVQDYEPDFFAASAERLWAEETYRMGYACMAASPWLAELLGDRYGAHADTFEFGFDPSVYRPLGTKRDEDTVVYYARRSTPRRATELGYLALDEVVRRRPGTNVLMFGDTEVTPLRFPHGFAGVLDPPELASLYNRAAVGVVVSLTNYSLIPKEMMACGLPVVDVRHPSIMSVFDSPEPVIELADMDFLSLADSIVSLLDDPARRRQMGAAASEFVRGMTWAAAADQIERIARRRLADRWAAALESA
jgi:glycosyltransferase involved in cell wall biosynthesis